MKPIFEKIAVFLSLIGSIGFVYLVYTKISEGKIFERYRTVWLYEIDYFSIVLMGVSILVFSGIYFVYTKIKDHKEIKHAKKDLEKRRNIDKN